LIFAQPYFQPWQALEDPVNQISINFLWQFQITYKLLFSIKNGINMQNIAGASELP